MTATSTGHQNAIPDVRNTMCSRPSAHRWVRAKPYTAGMCSAYQAASQYPSATGGEVSTRTNRRRSAAATIAGERPSTSSGGAQSASITFWSRCTERSDVSAMCSSGESRATAITPRPPAKAAIRHLDVGAPRRSNARTTTA